MNEWLQASGWWLASDGNWYPPEQYPPNRVAVDNQPTVGLVRGGTSLRAILSLVLPIIGGFATFLIPDLTNRDITFRSVSQLQQENNAGTASFFIAGIVAVVVGSSAVLLAVSAKRRIRAAHTHLGGQELSTVGLILAILLIGYGLLLIAAGLFLQGLNGLSF